MAGSAISTPTWMALAKNLYNENGTTPIYGSGAWDFKNASGTTTLAVSSAGAVTVGPTTANNDHFVLGSGLNIKRSTGAYCRIGISGSRSYIDAAGTDASTNGDFEFRSYRSDVSNVITTGSCSNAGAWTLGAASGAFQHLLNGGQNANTAGGAVCTIKNNNNATVWSFGPVANGAYVVYNSSDAGVYLTSGNTSWTANSDSRMKKNIVDCQLGLAEICNLRAVKFDYLNDASDNSSRVGFIAQEVYPILPHAVSKPEDEEQMMGISTTEMIPVLVKAIQELSAKLDEANAKIAALEAK